MITISVFWFGAWLLTSAVLGAVLGVVMLALVRNSDTD